MSVAFCNNEDDLREADRMLDAKSPSSGGPSGRVGVATGCAARPYGADSLP